MAYGLNSSDADQVMDEGPAARGEEGTKSSETPERLTAAPGSTENICRRYDHSGGMEGTTDGFRDVEGVAIPVDGDWRRSLTVGLKASAASCHVFLLGLAGEDLHSRRVPVMFCECLAVRPRVSAQARGRFSLTPGP